MFWTIFIFDKSKRYQRSDIKDNDQRYQLVLCYNVSKTSALFRYQLKRPYDVLHWSLSLRKRLIYRYDVSNLTVLFTYQWDAAKTFQIGTSYWRTSWDLVIMAQHVPERSDLSLKWINFFWVLDNTFFWHPRWFSLSKVSLLAEFVNNLLLLFFNIYISLILYIILLCLHAIGTIHSIAKCQKHVRSGGVFTKSNTPLQVFLTFCNGVDSPKSYNTSHVWILNYSCQILLLYIFCSLYLCQFFS